MVWLKNIWKETPFIHAFLVRMEQEEIKEFSDSVKTTHEYKILTSHKYVKEVEKPKEADTNENTK